MTRALHLTLVLMTSAAIGLSAAACGDVTDEPVNAGNNADNNADNNGAGNNATDGNNADNNADNNAGGNNASNNGDNNGDNNGVSCAADVDCEVGEFCTGGECEAAICTEEYDPVCGADGNTYGNACNAAAAHVEVASEGECRTESGCSEDADCAEGERCEVDECGASSCDGCDDCVAIWTCVPDEGGASCDADTDCEVGELCVEGACEGVDCTQEYDPVCGVDGNTYGNACSANVAHVEVDYEGECRPESECEGDAECGEGERCDIQCLPDPNCPECDVCLIHGECVPVEDLACDSDADCDTWHLCLEGVCESVACTDIYDPVCGEDGRTWSNSCYARANHVAVAYEGECRGGACDSNEDCTDREVCYPPTDSCEPACDIQCFRFDPVCGEDGRTYACGEPDAWCHGVEVDYEGECEANSGCEADTDCPRGQLCREGTCELVACPAVYAPVCGEDGNTWSNSCQAQANHVAVAYEGECEDQRCRSNADCGRGLVCYPPTNTCQPACAIDCIQADPVCGTDGNTYTCGQEDAWCNGVEVAHEGRCETNSECEVDTDCRIGALCSDAGQCEPIFCPAIYAPVCGEDGNTYGNSCEAQANHVAVAYEGECREDQRCRSNDGCEGDLICYPPTGTCQQACTINCFQEDPVCGTDGNTYSCGEQDAWCHGVEVDYEGRCDGETQCQGDADCPLWQICADSGQCQPIACPDIYAPVCGEDGRTYSNSCYAQANHVAVAHEGECESSQCGGNEDCEGDLICYPPTDTCQPACTINCFREDPVCGEDGRTYTCGEVDAWCHGTEVAYEGQCRSDGQCQGDTDCPQGQLCTEGACEWAICPRIYAPVCGTDGNTYGNSCEANAHHTEVAYEGECVSCHSSDDCREGRTCTVEEGDCRPDPDCPECDVCTGVCL